VKAAMQLTEKDLRMMTRLVKAQDRKIQAALDATAVTEEDISNKNIA